MTEYWDVSFSDVKYMFLPADAERYMQAIIKDYFKGCAGANLNAVDGWPMTLAFLDWIEAEMQGHIQKAEELGAAIHEGVNMSTFLVGIAKLPGITKQQAIKAGSITFLRNFSENVQKAEATIFSMLGRYLWNRASNTLCTTTFRNWASQAAYYGSFQL